MTVPEVKVQLQVKLCWWDRNRSNYLWVTVSQSQHPRRVSMTVRLWVHIFQTQDCITHIIARLNMYPWCLLHFEQETIKCKSQPNTKSCYFVWSFNNTVGTILSHGTTYIITHLSRIGCTLNMVYVYRIFITSYMWKFTIITVSESLVLRKIMLYKVI